VSGFSPAGTARALPVPPPVDPNQVGSTVGASSNGPTDSQPMIRGVGVNTATGAFTQHTVDAAMSSSYAIDVQAERSYSSLDSTPGVMGAGWSFSYQARVFPESQDCGHPSLGRPPASMQGHSSSTTRGLLEPSRPTSKKPLVRFS